MSATTERLAWIMSQLQKLQDEDRIRSEGWQVFQGAKAELQDTIDHPASEAPATVQRVLQPGELDAAISAAVGAAVEAAGAAMLEASAVNVNAAAAAIAADIQASDATVLGAINAKGDDIITALTPAV